MRIAIAQLNPTVWDIEGNVRGILYAAQKAADRDADVVAFGELAICGYYPGDRLRSEEFIAEIEAGLQTIITASSQWPGLHLVVGTVTRADGPGKPLHNSAAIVRGGKLIDVYSKQLLPTYDVFDERRHFEPGPERAVRFTAGDGTIVGVIVCEDGWNTAKLDYAIDPFEMHASKSDIVLSINASPSQVNKRDARHKRFSAAAKQHGLPVVYVNQIGGQDQLVFDGGSFACTPNEGVIFESKRFEESLDIINYTPDLDAGGGSHFRDENGIPLCIAVPTEGLPAPEFYRRQIQLGLRDYARRNGRDQVIVGCSGGIDSALTIALAAEVLGPQNVIAVTMPSAFSSSGSVTDSEALCSALGVPLFHAPILAQVEAHCSVYKKAFGHELSGVALENLQARVRAAVLLSLTNSSGALLLTTGNKSEISVGFYTIFGDSCGFLNLIGDLYKTDVKELAARFPAIPKAILEKPPSAELSPDQVDTDSLPPYDVLDPILKTILGDGVSPEEMSSADKFVAELKYTEEGRKTLDRVNTLVRNAEFKRKQAAPIIRLRPRAFGTGWQMPISTRPTGELPNV